MVLGNKKLKQLRLGDIHTRDPFVFVDKKDETYYLYATTDVCDGAANIEPHFEVYKSKDLKIFEGPYVAFMPPKGFWGVKHYWAPEVFEFEGKYYMFASFKGGIGVERATSVLISDKPSGPFVPYSDFHVTLPQQECLDGTLYFDKNSDPWVVFCHEWTQLYFGKIKALRLTSNLKERLNEDAITIVDTQTDDLPWIRQMVDPRVEKTGYLTDAPCMHRLQNGDLIMLWSSYCVKNYSENGFGGYCVAMVKSDNQDIDGKWIHKTELLLDQNIGHVSIFTTLEGQLTLVGHCNDTLHGSEFPVFLPIEEKDGILTIKKC